MKSTDSKQSIYPEERAVLLIYTGGTIGMVKNPVTGALEAFDFNHIQKHVPELSSFDFRIDTYAFAAPLDSSDVTPNLWIELATIIRDRYHKYTGFVILHGTDTMSFTASALSFMLQGLAKPVLLTGAQLPIDNIRTDGRENLLTSIEIAAACDKDGYPYVQEVCVLFGNVLLRGNRSCKTSTEDFDAFLSPNYSPLASVGIGIEYKKYVMLPRVSALQPVVPELKVHTTLDTNILVFKFFPGISINVLRQALNINGIKAVVVETFGNGNAPSNPQFVELIKEAVDRGLIVVNVTQCLKGRVQMQRYKTGITLLNIGVVSGSDITVEAAITKLMTLLGAGHSEEEVKQLMGANICGELTEEGPH